MNTDNSIIERLPPGSTTSKSSMNAYRSCYYSPCCQDSLNWCSCHWKHCLVCHLGPSSKRRCSRERSAIDLGPRHCPGATENENLVMMFGYAHGGYLMARTTPSPDGVIMAVATA